MKKRLTALRTNWANKQQGGMGYVLLWLLGVPDSGVDPDFAASRLQLAWLCHAAAHLRSAAPARFIDSQLIGGKQWNTFTLQARPWSTRSHATMRWSAIIGGWLVATGIASLMYVAGLAIGFTAFDPYNAAATAKGIGTGTAIWMILTWAVSLFLGGMFASWFDGRADQTVGTLHGVTVWGLSVAASGLCSPSA